MPTGIARIIYIVGLLLMILCIADVLLIRFAGIDVTGVRWTPIALGGTGIVLMQVARLMGMTARHAPDE